MKKLLFILMTMLSLLVIACGDSLKSIGYPAGEVLLALASITPSPEGPRVTSTTPVDGATDVARNTTVTAIFNDEVRCSTVSSSNFTVSEGGTPVTGTVSCTGLTAIFTPAENLSPAVVYTVTVQSSVQDLNNTPMDAAHTWSFTTTTSTGGPTVAATIPVNGATGIFTDTTITATFSEEMRCSTITSASFTLADGGTPVAGSVTCAGTSAEFTPSSLLTPGTVYTATMTTVVENSAGDPMAADHTWNFTTTATPNGPQVSLTSPANGATNVSTNAVITATFSEEVKCSTVTAASFNLNDGSPVAGTVECYGVTATFRPSVSMSLNTVYTATITTAVENLDGVSMAADHVWSFTVEAGPTLAQKLRGIWVIGGAAALSGGSSIQELDLYDPVTNTWYADVAAAATGNTYIPSTYGMVVYLAGKIYVMGGATDYATLTNRVQVYDIAANTWTTMTGTGVMPAVRMSSASYENNGYIYILGGTATNLTGGGVLTHYRYDPTLNTWITNLAAIPGTAANIGRVGISAFNFNGLLSFAGGKTLTGGSRTDMNQIYIVSSNTYTAGTEQALTSARSFMASGGYSGNNGPLFFMAGGVTSTAPATAFFNFTQPGTMVYIAQASSFIVYLPPSTSGGILTGAVCPTFTGGTTLGVAFLAGAVSPYNGSTSEDPTFYIFGGIKNRSTISDEVYAISANGTVSGTTYVTTGWSLPGSKGTMPRPRFGHSVVVAEP